MNLYQKINTKTNLLTLFTICMCAGAPAIAQEPEAADTDTSIEVPKQDAETLGNDTDMGEQETETETATASTRQTTIQPKPVVAAPKPIVKEKEPNTKMGPPKTDTKNCLCEDDATSSPIVPQSNNPFVVLDDEIFLGTLLIGAWGVYFWDWFEESVHFESEHGFSHKSATGGADKMGHFWCSYVMADFLNWRLRNEGWTPLRSTIVSASVAMGLMTWIEIGDSTSEYGFSWEDLLADFIGVSVSALLSLSPVVDDLLDFRMQYWPTSNYLDSGVLVADYTGMNYIMALRMTGIPPLKKTPLRFVEWHLGYYSRGFRGFDHTDSTNRVLYFGMGIDLKEVIDMFVPKRIKRPIDIALTYYQIPKTSWELKTWNHRRAAE